MTLGSLFSGIGGLDLGLERAGFRVRWQVEIDPWCRAVLAKHWPDVTRYADVRDLRGDELEAVDCICGGFPCQPVSVAGAQRGEADARWLWPEFARVVRAVRPRVVIVENVPGLLVRGLDRVLGDLAASGYDAEWDCIPAAAIGAPHERDRLFVVATADPARQRCDRKPIEQREVAAERRRASSSGASMAYADSGRCEGERIAESGGLEGTHGRVTDGRGALREFDDAAMADTGRARLPVSERAHVFGARRRQEGRAATQCDWWAVEPDVGRMAYGVPRRVDRLRALGNAVVPQVAEFVGRRVLEVMRG